MELLVFPLLGAGISGYEASDAAAPGHVLWIQSVVFAILAGGVVLALQVVQDLRSPTSGLYSVEAALDEMVEGLRKELRQRLEAAPGAPNHAISQLPSPEVSSFDERLAERETVEDWPSLQPRGEKEIQNNRLLQCALAGLASAALFLPSVLILKNFFSDPALQAIREDNNAQWLQNCFTGVGLVFSLFAAQTFSFLYSQQEAIYLAVYGEVSEAKALLEQLALVCRGRPTLAEALEGLQCYVREDLRCLDRNPAKLLAGTAVSEGRAVDPLERVLYHTSVGEPSAVYDTVKGLRAARGQRLGATQRKLPPLHFALLAALSVAELLVFPILAAGCAALDSSGLPALPGHILFFQAILFGLMASALTLTFLVLYDLWSPIGDIYNFQTVIEEMVSGMEEELEVRLSDARTLADDMALDGRPER
ncbi:tyrP-A [Symbiodinium natans]|uniref:TyrP-A protein n=1 Tax=Symbiodinium natans TaxID=878477 RepID=A0A812KNT6_9DINO|nr:tyrP-A [Symbiodinium natans]